MRLSMLNEYDFAPGASLNPKQDQQVKINRHSAVSNPSQPQPKHAGYDDPYDHYEDEATEIIHYLTGTCGDEITVQALAKAMSIDYEQVYAAAHTLCYQIYDNEYSILHSDILMPLIVEIMSDQDNAL